ncbi:MAG: hypothetical protein HYX61_12135 [Gammaproteobacteria bacterium]|jgi:Zn-dependent protease with chaperone function|nr:hypothetical protein [Gammaproteobacteria bacterium]
MFTWLSGKIKEKANFSWLAQASTSKKPWLLGFIPSVGTIIMLGLMAAAISGGIWLWAGFWSGAYASAAVFVPLLEKTLMGVIGFSILNFWFSREINTALLSTREAREPFVFSQKVNPTSLIKLVNHLRQEVNAHFKQKYGDNHVDMPMPRILNYTKSDFEISSEGRNPGKAGIFISTGAFDYKKTNMNQREVAALIQRELVKIYLRRGFFRTIAGIGSSLATTLENLNSSDFWFFKMLGTITAPLQFFIALIENSINRSFEYEASGEVIECGRGVDLIRAIDHNVNPQLETVATNEELKINQNKHQRKPYSGFLSSVLSPFTNWIDRNEYASDDKSGYRVMSMPDSIVREAIFYTEELKKKKPRATSEKTFIRPRVWAMIDGNEVSMDNATTEQVEIIQKRQLAINDGLYKQIPKNDRYDAIGPRGTGCVTPILEKNGLAPIVGGGKPILLAQARAARGHQRDAEPEVRPAQEGTHHMRLRRNR